VLVETDLTVPYASVKSGSPRSAWTGSTSTGGPGQRRPPGPRSSVSPASSYPMLATISALRVLCPDSDPVPAGSNGGFVPGRRRHGARRNRSRQGTGRGSKAGRRRLVGGRAEARRGGGGWRGDRGARLSSQALDREHSGQRSDGPGQQHPIGLETDVRGHRCPAPSHAPRPVPAREAHRLARRAAIPPVRTWRWPPPRRPVAGRCPAKSTAPAATQLIEPQFGRSLEGRPRDANRLSCSRSPS
jgi:hypothetical protein